MAEIQFAKLKLKSEFGHNGFTWRRVQQKGCCNNKNKFNAIRTDDKTVKKFFKGASLVEYPAPILDPSGGS